MLGFDPGQDIHQITMDFMFDDDAEKQTKSALMSELPQLIFDPSVRASQPPTLENLFTRVCNETPATAKLISDVLIDLRNEKEVDILTKNGRPKPRSTHVDWTDLILPSKELLLFSKLRRPSAT